MESFSLSFSGEPFCDNIVNSILQFSSADASKNCGLSKCWEQAGRAKPIAHKDTSSSARPTLVLLLPRPSMTKIMSKSVIHTKHFGNIVPIIGYDYLHLYQLRVCHEHLNGYLARLWE